MLKKKLNGEADATSCQIDYLYDATGKKWQKKARTYKQQVTTGSLPPPRTHYTYYGQGIHFESDEVAGTTNALSHILHEEGRVIKDPQSGQLAYEYHYSDHLGNLRVAFRQQTPTVSQATLSFEPQHAAQEEAAFDRVGENRAAGLAQQGRYAARLQREAGPSKTVRLLAGETLKASVFAYFEQPKHKRTTWLPLPILGQEKAMVDGKAKSRLVLRSGVVLPLKFRRKANQPEAYLELVVKDTAGTITHQERSKITRIASEQWQELNLEYKAQANETAEISLVNESHEAAYFDNLTLSQEPPIIVQENHYDPWGLNLAGIQKQGNPDHKWQYNGIEKNDDLGINVYDAFYRTLDPQLGRWWQIDPKVNEMESPYVAMSNNPIRYSDPLGDTIRVRGSDEFKAQYATDRANLMKTKKGKALIEYLESSEKDVFISEATSTVGAIKEFFGGDGQEDHLFASETKGTPNGDVVLKYSQVEGVEYDKGVKSKSYVTLAHELQHGKDLVSGFKDKVDTQNKNSPAEKKVDIRKLMETRAVHTENLIRVAFGDNNIRTTYGDYGRILPKGVTYKDYQRGQPLKEIKGRR